MDRSAAANQGKPPDARPLLAVTVCCALLTAYLLHLYGVVHWEIGVHQARLRASLLALENAISARMPDPRQNAELQPIQQDLAQASGRLAATANRLMRRLDVFRLTGVTAFIFGLLCCLRQPRWVRFVALPFALLGLFMAFVIM